MTKEELRKAKKAEAQAKKASGKVPKKVTVTGPKGKAVKGKKGKGTVEPDEAEKSDGAESQPAVDEDMDFEDDWGVPPPASAAAAAAAVVPKAEQHEDQHGFYSMGKLRHSSAVEAESKPRAAAGPLYSRGPSCAPLLLAAVDPVIAEEIADDAEDAASTGREWWLNTTTASTERGSLDIPLL